jgi:hypothetical protein
VILYIAYLMYSEPVIPIKAMVIKPLGDT